MHVYDSIDSFSVFELYEPDGHGALDFSEIIQPLNSDDQSILHSISKKSKVILVEREYIDKDYRNVYSGFYSKKFTKYNNRTVRVHFFSVKINVNSIVDSTLVADLERQSGTEQNCEGTTKGYLGYVVIRPTEYSRIGRCILDPRMIGDFSQNPDRVEGCLARYSSTIAGNKLTISAFPHQSQDAEAHICAHTAVWSLFRYLSQRYPIYKESYPYDIVMLNKDLSHGRPLPGRGLYMDQITAMFGHFGLGAEMYDDIRCEPSSNDNENGWATIHTLDDGIAEKDVMIRLLHQYIESGVPPIIGLPGHAAVALGVCTSNKMLIERDGQTIPCSDFLSAIIVNDDNYGPYKIAKRLSSDFGGYSHSVVDIDSFIVPFPDKVFLNAEDAEIITTDFLNNIGEPIVDTDNSVDKGPKFVRRMYCTSSRNYKQFRSRDKDQASAILMLQSLPHFLWVTEILSLASWESGEREVLVEVVLDATAGPYDTKPYLWIRYPDFLIINTPRLYETSESNNDHVEIDIDCCLTQASFSENLSRFN